MMKTAAWLLLGVGPACLIGAYLMFGLEFYRADAELRPGNGITWPEWALAALGMACIAASIAIRHKVKSRLTSR